MIRVTYHSKVMCHLIRRALCLPNDLAVHRSTFSFLSQIEVNALIRFGAEMSVFAPIVLLVVFVVLLRVLKFYPTTPGCYKIDNNGARFQFFCSKTQILLNETCTNSRLWQAMQESNSNAITELKISGCGADTVKLAVKEFKNVNNLDISYLNYGSNDLDGLLWGQNLSTNNETEIKPQQKIVIQDFVPDYFVVKEYNMNGDLSKSTFVSLPKHLNTIHMENMHASYAGSFPCYYYWLSRIPLNVYIALQSVKYFNIKCIKDPIQFVISTSNEFIAAKNGTLEVHVGHATPIKFEEITARTDQINEKQLSNLMNNVAAKKVYLVGSDQSTELDFLNLKKITGLKELNIGDTNLKAVKNPSALQFINLTNLYVRRSKIENVREIIKYLNPSIEHLDLTGSSIGELNADLFKNLTNLKWLDLSETNMAIIDSSPFDQLKQLEGLEVSGNDLSRMKVPLLSSKSEHLGRLSAKDCRMKNAGETIHSLGPSIKYIELSTNFIGELTTDTFEGMKQLELISLSNTSLSIGDSNPFEHLERLKTLVISHNDLSNTNLTILSPTLQRLSGFKAAHCKIRKPFDALALFSKKMQAFDVSGNEISEIHNFKKEHFPYLYSMGFTEIPSSRAFVKQLKREWPELRIGNDGILVYHFG